jgi:cytochrome c oxidase cbb3-type subunit 1
MQIHWRTVLYSPTMRFMFVGGLCYVLVSMQGSVEAWRSVSTVVHFTHYTVGHAHLGLYGFFSFIMFGAIYYVMPRVLNWEWPYPKLIQIHFWLSTSGIIIYFFSLSLGGWLQGFAMLDEHKPFLDSVLLTLPFLKSRTLGGALMTAGHLIFALHFYIMVLRHGPVRSAAAVIGLRPEKT